MMSSFNNSAKAVACFISNGGAKCKCFFGLFCILSKLLDIEKYLGVMIDEVRILMGNGTTSRTISVPFDVLFHSAIADTSAKGFVK